MNLSNLQIGVFLVIMGILAGGCGIQPLPGGLKKEDYLNQGVAVRKQVKGTEPKLGLALAGGGTKAADFSIGVLQGLTEAGIMEEVDAVSTVSGGGYAALWYFSRLLNPEETKLDAATPLTSNSVASQFFKDCLPHKYLEYYFDTLSSSSRQARHAASTWGPCPANSSTNYEAQGSSTFADDMLRYQNHLRGFQDIFAWNWRRPFRYKETSLGVEGVAWEFLGSALLTVGAFGINLVPNVLFDWEVPLSSSRLQYQAGILRAFGATPTVCTEQGEPCVGNFRLPGSEDWVRNSLTFDRLRREYELGRIPLWIINATAGESRDVFSAIAHPGQKPFQFTTFEFSPYGSGSGLFGYSTQMIDDLRPWEAVTVSAAFLDAQQKVYPAFYNIFLHALTLSWGRSSPNPQIQWYERWFHKALPLPLYLLHGRSGDSSTNYVNVRLSDGGQSEDLGAYALIQRNLPDIIISDHSADRSGRMEDVCRLKKGLLEENLGHPRLYVYLPGLDDLDRVCNQNGEVGIDIGYDIFNWEHPILLGCVTDDPLNTKCGDMATGRQEHFQRLYLIKPALPNSRSQHKLGKALVELGNVLHKKTPTCRGGDDHLRCAPMAVPACSSPDAGVRYPYPDAVTRPMPKHWQYEDYVSCELIGFIIANASGEGGLEVADGCPYIPQNSTVNLTADSSPYLFGAYRELGRYYARQLGWFFGDSDSQRMVDEALRRERFQDAIAYQIQHPLVRKAILQSGAKAGAPGDCLY